MTGSGTHIVCLIVRCLEIIVDEAHFAILQVGRTFCKNTFGSALDIRGEGTILMLLLELYEIMSSPGLNATSQYVR